MRHDKLGLQLDLLLLMTENHDYTAAQLCDRLGISLRNLYYYLDFFRDAGFRVIKSGTCYRLDRHSPFSASSTSVSILPSKKPSSCAGSPMAPTRPIRWWRASAGNSTSFTTSASSPM